MNAFVFMANVFDVRPPELDDQRYPPVSVLIAAYNEIFAITSTLTSLFNQSYSSPMRIILISDGSYDLTVDVVREIEKKHPNLELIYLQHNGGKAAALNLGLEKCKTDIVISVDADCYLHRDGIKNLVSRYWADPLDTRAVAGSILIRNSRENWITKAQEWDYFLGIGTVKRIQSLFHGGTLVAQGAFSLYDRKALVEMGGWPEKVGEDIVLTWKFLSAGYRVGYAQDAMAFTNCPNMLEQFIKQRRRWSRGLMEAFKECPMILFKPRLTTLYIWWNTMFPLMDIAYTFGFIPGLILACFGKFSIVGPMTLSFADGIFA